MPLLEEYKLEKFFHQYSFPQSFFPLFNRYFFSIPQFFRPPAPVNLIKMSFYGNKKTIIIQPMGIFITKFLKFMIFCQNVSVFLEGNSKNFLFILSNCPIINPFSGEFGMTLYVRFQKSSIFHHQIRTYQKSVSGKGGKAAIR